MILQPRFPEIITSSTRSIFNGCPQKFFNSIVCGLQLRGVPNVHIHCGKSYAKALEAFRREYHTTRNYDAAVAKGLQALIEAYGPHDPPEGETKTFERTVGAFVEYLVRYPPESDHLRPLVGVFGPRVEFSFSFEVPDCYHPVTKAPILYGGTIDEPVEFNGLIFIMDDKTTGAMGPTWKYQWGLRSQFTGYVYGLKNGMPEIASRVAGAIVRGMCILKESFKSEEVITMRPDWMIERWKKRLVWDVQRMIKCFEEGYWPHMGEENGECHSFGQCPFTTLCSSQYFENFLDVEYEVVRKDPITHEREK
jgi:hypothetical protein